MCNDLRNELKCYYKRSTHFNTLIPIPIQMDYYSLQSWCRYRLRCVSKIFSTKKNDEMIDIYHSLIKQYKCETSAWAAKKKREWLGKKWCYTHYTTLHALTFSGKGYAQSSWTIFANLLFSTTTKCMTWQ